MTIDEKLVTSWMLDCPILDTAAIQMHIAKKAAEYGRLKGLEEASKKLLYLHDKERRWHTIYRTAAQNVDLLKEQ